MKEYDNMSYISIIFYAIMRGEFEMELNDFLEMFIEESKDHLQAINEELLKLEAEPDNTSIVNEIFRSAHTLKGMAATMGFEDLASLTHEMENVLDLLRNSKLKITSEIMDVIFTCVDFIEKMVNNIEQSGDGKENVTEVVFHLRNIQDPSTPKNPGAYESGHHEVAATAELKMDEYQTSVINEAMKFGNHLYQISVRLDENCIMKSVRAYMVFQVIEELGEVIQTNPSVEQIEEEGFDDTFSLLILSQADSQEIQKQLLNVSEVKEVHIFDQSNQEIAAVGKSEIKEVEKFEETSKPAGKEEIDSSKKKSRSKSIRVDIEKLDQLMNLFSELIIDRGRLEQISRKSQLPELTETVEHMTRISTNLQGLILNMRMVPVEQVFNRFPRMVRDLAKELSKKIQLVVEGAETELDRTVIDEIGDPLVHLLRNALDHGLESTEERIVSKKQEEGKIILKAYHSGNHVFIEVIDNGKGIDREKVLNKAIERGVVSVEESHSLSDTQVYSLLFSSGFSTADKISDISGRGVGLDVVKTKIESLGGVISVDSTLGQGSVFRIQLPLTLSIINSMLVKVVDEIYSIPFNSIVEITNVSTNEVTTLHGRKVIQFRGKVVPLIYLKEAFQVPAADVEAESEELFIVVVRKGDKSVGLVVDAVLEQQEVVLKSLGGFLTNLYAISGATILGNGEVALIIDSNQFIK
jgi:two-component system, chemotaxis family, sensor kinase CheA